MNQRDRREVAGLGVDLKFFEFVENELLPEIQFDASSFWSGLSSIVNELTPENRELLAVRQEYQRQIDGWHTERAGRPWDREEYTGFLRKTGYIAQAGEPFEVTTANVDPEIAGVAGPQLVVPVDNARFALNAANARWGSLYDALYGTDVISEESGQARGDGYNPTRGAAVIEYSTAFLDRAVPLEAGGYRDVTGFAVDEQNGTARLVAALSNGGSTTLKQPANFVGHATRGTACCYLLRHNGLHIELQADPQASIRETSDSPITDIILESAVTVIQDCEDSVAAVDAEDKVTVYRNWLGLMRGTLEAAFDRPGGKSVTRRLNSDRHYTGTNGESLVLPGRSLMLIRNVGHLMTTDAILDKNGDEVFEGILDAVLTTACALANRRQNTLRKNSSYGSIYIVKPKMHGPDEAAFTNTLFGRVEAMLDLQPNTVKVGVMDEERRTTVNLEECIRAVRERLVFINTGFLDRTGDEIHTSMQAGTMLPKHQIKDAAWINAYEDWNVDIGIRCGLPGKAQIGKGMWAKPDEMKQMMDTKEAQLQAGATCAWVPSPSAATLHAMHYHYVDVRERQRQLSSRQPASLDDILQPPLCEPSELLPDAVQAELDNNAQGILGYVVRWVDQGIGCSKVPDIDDIGLMEDRATLRISSQHIANWLLHGVTNEQQVRSTFERMARVVDEQNAGDPNYRRMSDDFDGSLAFSAACDLVFKGVEQPNGYTEPLLQTYRIAAKRGRSAVLRR